MIKSINIWAFEEGRTLPEVFRIAKANNFGGVELTVDDNGALTFDSSEADCKRICEQAADAGIILTSIVRTGWAYPLISHDAATRRKAIELTTQALHIARWLSVDALLHVPGGVNAEMSYDAAYEYSRSALMELKNIAEETGVTIGLENVWNKFLLSPLEFRALLDEIDSPRVGCYFDVGNVVLNGFPEQWIRILGTRIARVHFKDFKREVGTLAGFCPLLDGNVDYAAVMNALREIGYDGPVAAEFENAEADLPQISKTMDEIFKL